MRQGRLRTRSPSHRQFHRHACVHAGSGGRLLRDHRSRRHRQNRQRCAGADGRHMHIFELGRSQSLVPPAPARTERRRSEFPQGPASRIRPAFRPRLRQRGGQRSVPQYPAHAPADPAPAPCRRARRHRAGARSRPPPAPCGAGSLPPRARPRPACPALPLFADPGSLIRARATRAAPPFPDREIGSGYARRPHRRKNSGCPPPGSVPAPRSGFAHRPPSFPSAPAPAPPRREWQSAWW